MKNFFFFSILFSFTFTFGQVTNEGKPKSWKLNLNTAKTEDMPPFNLNQILKEDTEEDGKAKPFRFGYEHQVSLGFENGRWNTLKNGDRVWLMNIKSEGAKTLNFVFDEYYIPEGAKLYFYNNDKTDLLGAYTSTQNRDDLQFGSWLVNGDHIWIEYYEPANAAFSGQLHISKVVHGYRSVNDIPELSKALNDSGACNQDVDCPVGDDFDLIKNEVKKSVGLILVGSTGFCSGTLINNTENDEQQLFLTANHCLGSSVSSWAFRFNWTSPEPSCSSLLRSTDGDFNQTISGANLLASNPKSDFALLEITPEFPNNWDLIWAGWDRSGAVPDFTVGIHHPRGDIMKIARDNDSPSQSSRSFNGFDAMKNWLIENWELGVTEPGSSGSALFDPEGKIIGQLAGGSAACDGTFNNGGFDFYGRFDVSWDAGDTPDTRLKDWLDPNDKGDLVLNQFPPIQVLDNDVALFVENLDQRFCGDEASSIFRILNKGQNSVTSATLTYRLGTGDEQTINWTGDLARGESDVIAAVSIDLSTGTDFEAMLEIDGQDDEFLEDNLVKRSINNFQDRTFDVNSVTFTLLTDDFAEETSWEFLDLDGNLIAQSQGNLIDNRRYVEQFEVEPGKCYQLIIYDDAGDGICCGFGRGFYRLETDDGEVIASGGEFGEIQIEEFRILQSKSEHRDFIVFPNPTSSMLTVLPENQGDFEVNVYDFAGKLLLESRGEEELHLNLEAFPNGMYFVKLRSESTSVTKKIIKK